MNAIRQKSLELKAKYPPYYMAMKIGFSAFLSCLFLALTAFLASSAGSENGFIIAMLGFIISIFIALTCMAFMAIYTILVIFKQLRNK